MSNMDPRTNYFIMICLILILVAVMIILNKSEWNAKNAPNDPQVNEQISQARALQKQGKLDGAIVVFERYALQGYPDAMFHTAKAYSRGWGVAPDLEKARHYYLLAVQYSYSYRGETAYELGRLFQRALGPDCNTVAVEWFKKALNWNYTKAALQLAIHYEKGLGVEQDIDQAIDYYQIAAQAGYEQALMKYARVLVKGRYGVIPDPDRAYDLTSRAVISLERKARGGSASAAKQLGRLYRDGELVPQNQAKAEQWLLQSARLGSTGGMHDLAHMMLDEDNDPEKHTEALDWMRKAADRGHGGAMTAMGRFHLDEKYGLQRPAAVGWFEQGVEAGHGGAFEELARLYAVGDLVPQNTDKAIALAEKGTRSGHLGSERLLNKLTTERAETRTAAVTL